MTGAQQNRNTIYVEDAAITDVRIFPDNQFIMRLNAPRCARTATPGSFIFIRCDESISMRRPLSIMRADATNGWVEILFKIVGAGMLALSKQQRGDTVSIIGPVGQGFEPFPERRLPLLIGGGVGIPPMVFLAEMLKNDYPGCRPLVIMGSEIPFPFELSQSKLVTPWLAKNVNSTMPLLEDWGIPTRLASLQNYDGCFDGYVTDLARDWLNTLAADELAQVEIFACGPTPMLKAVALLAQEFNLRCEVSLEEFMACAVGGCAGCAVSVKGDDGTIAMRRVCVDGPVFDAATVFGG